MSSFTEFECMIVCDMIKLGLDPYNREDIEKFWECKLPTSEDSHNAS